jgi:tryptophan synthase alpha chain
VTGAPGGEARVRSAFARAAAEGRSGFVARLTVGYPDPAGGLAAARTLARWADVLELALPFSEAHGDAPIVQRSAESAMAHGTRSADVLELFATLRGESDVALVVVSYYNPIYCYAGPRRAGEEGFVRDFAAAGADGVLVPDLPADEADTLIPLARGAGLATVFQVASTSTPSRLRTVTGACRGFVRAVIAGVGGGEPEQEPHEAAALVARARAHTDLPIALAAGSTSHDGVARLARRADGVVVGSALLQTLSEKDDLEAQAAAFAAACRR